MIVDPSNQIILGDKRVYPIEYTKYKTSIQHLVELLQFKLSEKQLPLTALEGIEIQYYESEDSDERKVGLYPGNYILIKLLTKKVPRFVSIIFYELQLLGYIPILSNADQYLDFRKHPNKLVELVNRGVLVQINASSLIGQNGKRARRFSLKLCKHNLVHFISSDNQFFEKRPMLLKSAYEYLQKKISYDYVKELQGNTDKLNLGTEFIAPPPIMFK